MTRRACLSMVFTVLLAVTPGCDVFMPDWGAWDMPCNDDGDCADGLRCSFDRCIDWIECDNDYMCMAELRWDPMWMYAFCNQWGECEIPAQTFEIGKQCDPGRGNADCGGDFGLCVEFDKDLFLCTRECWPDSSCNLDGKLPFELRCAFLHDLTGISVCTRPAWTPHLVGYRCELDKQDQCKDRQMDLSCVDVGIPAGPVCTQPCVPGESSCPLDLFCAFNEQADGHACAYPPWVGFGMSCGDNGCPAESPFNYCTAGGEYCSKPCEGDQDCPLPLRCSEAADSGGSRYCLGGDYH